MRGGDPRRAGQHRRQSAGREKLRLSGGDLAAARRRRAPLPARAGVAEPKLPDRVECVAALPLTPVGKVDKKQLRQWLAEGKLG